ncbi:hypothetical protein Q1695_011656 [Nippostrongylus brasiliensis]|nr:hypothetical protein Q1695_011656 [Nippostrongylus brasiliensis]
MEEVFTESYAGRPVRKVSCRSVTFIATGGPYTNGVLNTLCFYLSSIRSTLVDVFLPQGYPYSVSEDYLQYQLWDTLQAFASSMTGALATEAVLKGAGVGDQTASALAASLTWLAKDGLGMVGRIVFGFLKGRNRRSELDSDCKKWRLVADILNDLAFFIDLLSPAIKGSFFVCACTSSLLRCVVGVAGGATRTAITQHQARRNNLADVASKDGSQETMVNVTALLMSFILLPLVSGKQLLIWSLFMVFTSIHLYANYRAVRSLIMETLNLNRATILIRHWLSTGKLLSVAECNDKEPLFSKFGRRYLGCSLSDIRFYHNKVPSAKMLKTDDYVILIDTRRDIGWVAVADSGTAQSHLRAVFDLEALAAGEKLPCQEQRKEKDFDAFIEGLRVLKWNTDANNLGFDEWTYSRK